MPLPDPTKPAFFMRINWLAVSFSSWESTWKAANGFEDVPELDLNWAQSGSLLNMNSPGFGLFSAAVVVLEGTAAAVEL